MSLHKFWMFSILATSFLHGEEEGRMRQLENRVTCLEETQASCCCVINPPARPYPADCLGFMVSITPVVWQANVNGLPVAVETSGSTEFFNNTGRSSVKNLNFCWDWGFRLGVGVNTPYDAWEVNAIWTYWNTDGSKNVTAGSGNILFPTQGHPARSFDEVANSVESRWEMHYNLLDLELGREFYVSKCFTLRPFGGLRSAWIEQEFDVNYLEITPNNLNIPANRHDIDKLDRFWGIGIRGGIDMQWNLPVCFSLFTNFSGNLLYAYHSLKTEEKLLFPDGSVATILRFDDFHHVGTTIFDMQIGLRFDWISCCGCYHIGIDFGWENVFHHGQNQFINFVDRPMPGKFVENQGDLGIQGWFFKARFDF